MVVALEESTALQFKEAHQKGDKETMRQLAGDFIIPVNKFGEIDIPPHETENYIQKVKDLISEIPTVFLSLILKPAL